MSEEAPGAEEATQENPEGDAPDAPPADPPATDWESEDNPYRKRYEDLRPQYDQIQNVVSALSNPDQQAAVLRHFGIELEDGEQEDDFDADEPLTRAEFQEWQSRMQAAEDAHLADEQALDSDASAIAEQLEAIEKEHGELSDEMLSILLPNAIANRDEYGAPRFTDAFNAFSTEAQRSHQAYLKSKRAAKVQGGTAGVEKINLADEEQRSQLMAEVMAATQEAEDS